MEQKALHPRQDPPVNNLSILNYQDPVLHSGEQTAASVLNFREKAHRTSPEAAYADSINVSRVLM